MHVEVFIGEMVSRTFKSAKKTRYRDGGGSSSTPKDAPSLCNYQV